MKCNVFILYTNSYHVKLYKKAHAAREEHKISREILSKFDIVKFNTRF